MMQGSSLLAYGVGLGKTWCAIFNIAQNLSYGFCKRPLIVLPNQVYPQFVKEISGYNTSI
jgi:N12 class adenine-specific DNA methylase